MAVFLDRLTVCFFFLPRHWLLIICLRFLCVFLFIRVDTLCTLHVVVFLNKYGFNIFLDCAELLICTIAYTQRRLPFLLQCLIHEHMVIELEMLAGTS
jgi:hypothetical protein